MLVALIPCWLFILLNLFIYGCFLLCGSSYAVGMVWGARTSTSPAPPEKPHRPQRQGLWYHHQQQHHHLTQYEHTAADASIPDAEKHAAHATQVSLENTLRIYISPLWIGEDMQCWATVCLWRWPNIYPAWHLQWPLKSIFAFFLKKLLNNLFYIYIDILVWESDFLIVI